MTFRDYIAEMHSSLLDYNFEDSHKTTWDNAEKETAKRIIKILDSKNTCEYDCANFYRNEIKTEFNLD